MKKYAYLNVVILVITLISLFVGCATGPEKTCGNVCDNGKVDSYVLSEQFMCFCKGSLNQKADNFKQNYKAENSSEKEE